MPYIMVMGSLSSQHLSKDEGATVYGLKSEERATLVRVSLVQHFSLQCTCCYVAITYFFCVEKCTMLWI